MSTAHQKVLMLSLAWMAGWGTDLAFGTGGVSCPNGWTMFPSGCRPIAPSSEYIRNATPDDNYPVCGPGRLPVGVRNGLWTALNIASSGTPRTNDSTTDGTQTYRFTAPSSPSNVGKYYYNEYSHCMCAGKTYSNTSLTLTAADLPGLLPGSSTKRFEDDSKEVIERVATGTTLPAGQPLSTKYSPVSLYTLHSSGSVQDAREGTVVMAGNSRCRCPNFNEEMVSVSNSLSEIAGSYCRPRITGAIKLSNFYAGYPGMSEQIMDKQDEQDSAGNLITQVVVPDHERSGSTSSAVYNRRIWLCDGGRRVNTATGNCDMVLSYHAAGMVGDSVTTGPTSIVSPRIRGIDDDVRWKNTVNKKLSACLNGFGANTGTATSGQKFDCIANDFVAYKDFNELWSSTDAPADGGLPNALVLAGADGRPVSGFYTLGGKHCDQYSEFGGELQYTVVNPKTGTQSSKWSEIDYKGSVPLPGEGPGGAGGTSSEYGNMRTKINLLIAQMIGNTLRNNPTIPTTAEQRRECPILVRAAAIYKCPEIVQGQSISTYEERDAGTDKVVRSQCSVAKEIKVQMRIEQLTEIRGLPKMTTIDTVLNSPTDKSGVSIQRVIAEKYGVFCPPGTKRNQATGACEAN